MNRHPTDAEGRVLPAPGWPAERAAPGRLELLRHFLNTTNRENGADGLCDAAGLDAWLRAEGLARVRADAGEVAHVRTVRELVHRLVTANTAAGPDEAAAAALAATLDGTRLGVDAHRGGLVLRPAGRGGVDRLLGELAVVVLEAQASGSFSRLTACRHCRWVVYDGSKNRSGRWCSMGVCGGRENAKAYRRRHVRAGPSGAHGGSAR